ncbi:MAG TPA: S8 family serine peptidase [Anaerolineales bacterium]|nr:S8 family serine peptidase [Anaerolineales bacterium]
MNKHLSPVFIRKAITTALCVLLLASGFFPLAGLNAGSAAASGFYDLKIDPALQTQLGALPLDAPLEVVVVFSDPAAAPQVEALASLYFGMETLPMAGAVLTAGQIEQIAAWPEIYSITLNSDLEYFLAESVPLVKADQVWAQYAETGENVTVAVVDTGIDATHPDLLYGEKVVQNVKFLPFQAALENLAITDQTSGHGTHVAGTIGGTGFVSEGYYKGVAPDVSIVGLGAGETIGVLTAVQAYDWILTHHEAYNIRVVNNSWGSSGGDVNLRNPIVMATYAAYQEGILSVFASGNSGGYDIINPYSIAPWLLSVAAGKKNGGLAEFSSRGADGDFFKHPDIVAPGVDIYAARAQIGADSGLSTFPNPVNPLWTGHYVSMSGTSMATPHVVGAAALLFSGNPNLSPDEVMYLLTANATPMPGFMLHEAGYGYMDVLAAYEESLAMPGNLAEFLAGDQQFSEGDVLGFDPDEPVPFDEYQFSGLTVVGATGVSPPIDHTFEVPEGTLYGTVAVEWTPQTEDAFDMEVLDPQGRVVVSSGNGLDIGESALFVPDVFGTYTLRLYPFAAAAAQYTATVKIAYGNQPENWPPNTAPNFDRYLGVVGLYKTYGLVGIITENFRAGDMGFLIFSLIDADGVPENGLEDSIQAIYTDRLGNIAFVDDAIFARSDPGEYDSSITLDDSWQGVAGPTTVTFSIPGSGTLRALPFVFNVNHLDVTLQTGAGEYEPGDTVGFSGAVAQVTTLLTGEVEQTPLAGATVTVSLLDGAGNPVATTQVTTDLFGTYSSSFTAPAGASGQMTLSATSDYVDPLTAVGPADWYGEAQTGLSFPGNQPPQVSLTGTKQTDPGKKNFIHFEAAAFDPDGQADIAELTLVLTDDKGRELNRWTLEDFSPNADGLTWELEGPYKVSGKGPWTLTLTAVDSAGESAAASVSIDR